MIFAAPARVDAFDNVVIVVAGLLALVTAWWFGMHEHRCTRCGGKGRHRKDCPLR